MSLEDERARQAASNPPAAAPALETVPESAASGAPAVPVESVAEPVVPAEAAVEDVVIPEAGSGEGAVDEDEELRQALALSRGDDVDMGGEDDEEAEIARASEHILRHANAHPQRSDADYHYACSCIEYEGGGGGEQVRRRVWRMTAEVAFGKGEGARAEFGGGLGWETSSAMTGDRVSLVRA